MQLAELVRVEVVQQLQIQMLVRPGLLLSAPQDRLIQMPELVRVELVQRLQIQMLVRPGLLLSALQDRLIQMRNQLLVGCLLTVEMGQRRC